MSTFKGRLEEESLQFIRIDNFEEHNYNGTLFFLSHFHSDHYLGIFSHGFLKELVDNENKMLFCSELTRKLILRDRRCRIPEHKITTIPINVPYILEHEDKEPVQVVTVPAEHCPGSVMFLFEQKTIRVLYTGDFRLDVEELSKFRALHDSSRQVKPINSLYLDTTFCREEFEAFPSRNETLSNFSNLVSCWLQDDPSHEVGILYNTYYGLEPVLIKLANEVKTRVWVVDPTAYNNYRYIPELEYFLTMAKGDTRIHLCRIDSKGNCFVCGQNRSKFLCIKPCALSFTTSQIQEGMVKRNESSGLTRIPYATHCSLLELRAVVQYLKPDKVFPCVVPAHMTVDKILENLQFNLDCQEIGHKENHPAGDEPAPKKARTEFGKVESDQEDECYNWETFLGGSESTTITSEEDEVRVWEEDKVLNGNDNELSGDEDLLL